MVGKRRQQEGVPLGYIVYYPQDKEFGQIFYAPGCMRKNICKLERDSEGKLYMHPFKGMEISRTHKAILQPWINELNGGQDA